MCVGFGLTKQNDCSMVTTVLDSQICLCLMALSSEMKCKCKKHQTSPQFWVLNLSGYARLALALTQRCFQYCNHNDSQQKDQKHCSMHARPVVGAETPSSFFFLLNSNKTLGQHRNSFFPSVLTVNTLTIHKYITKINKIIRDNRTNLAFLFSFFTYTV